eukprot:CAMPEP_0181225940 /NCGR_PEP_ID=MMETSP1096-20121128/31981_1 /TAXON_ID=156174 ORGANISM="Chrysochromulina ericina, Strain CCMP281" /NCGR_SAMPLE_ID=MMETSP1096 /ASSEMBLY_ACC=CAM_ASM_000453 /LENGTH=55 /DNA_ID=CAMNT_0023319229 /DNA_START=689 /DNA_END=856 /DNA_ORIENTATION=+
MAVGRMGPSGVSSRSTGGHQKTKHPREMLEALENRGPSGLRRERGGTGRSFQLSS